MKNKLVRRLTLMLAIILVLTITIGVFAAYMYRKYNSEVMVSNNLQASIEDNTRANIYVASTPIKAGDRIITEDMAKEANKNNPADAKDVETAGTIINNTQVPNVTLVNNISSSVDYSLYITKDQLGQVALIDIPQGQPIMTNMVKELSIEQDTREYEISAVNLMADQENNDYIDVRIVYPNGEDLTVLPKKKISGLSLKNNVFYLNLNEDEIMRYQSAVIDTYQTTGARLYTDRYVEGNLQNEAVPNYLVRTEVIDLIKSDPNIYTQASQTLNAAARLSLETRLGQLTDDQLSAVSDGFGLTDTAKGAVLQENVDNNADQIDALGIDKAGSTSGSSDNSAEVGSSKTSSSDKTTDSTKATDSASTSTSKN